MADLDAFLKTFNVGYAWTGQRALLSEDKIGPFIAGPFLSMLEVSALLGMQAHG